MVGALAVKSSTGQGSVGGVMKWGKGVKVVGNTGLLSSLLELVFGISIYYPNLGEAHWQIEKK